MGWGQTLHFLQTWSNPLHIAVSLKLHPFLSIIISSRLATAIIFYYYKYISAMSEPGACPPPPHTHTPSKVGGCIVWSPTNTFQSKVVSYKYNVELSSVRKSRTSRSTSQKKQSLLFPLPTSLYIFTSPSPPPLLSNPQWLYGDQYLTMTLMFTYSGRSFRICSSMGLD